MSSRESRPVARPDSVATPAHGGLLDSGPRCLHCRQAIPRPRKGQQACSARCRWALWKAGQQTAAKVRDRKIREYLVMAEESLGAAKRLLEGDGGRR